MSDLLYNASVYTGGRQGFTKEGLETLIKLLTEGQLEIVIEGDEIVLSPLTEDLSCDPVLKVRLANVIASSVNRIEQSADDDAHRAYCELYGLAGLLREGAKLAEQAAREIDPYRWHNTQLPLFIRQSDDFIDWHIPKEEDEDQ